MLSTHNSLKKERKKEKLNLKHKETRLIFMYMCVEWGQGDSGRSKKENHITDQKYMF